MAHARCLAILVCASLAQAPALGQSPRPWPDTFVARFEALALAESLNATLLASPSATFALDTWCADHRLSNAPTTHARLNREVDKAASAEQRAPLEVGPDEPIKFRQVELACGDRVLSIANNWYVPSRLAPAMNQTLETTDTPFGRVVADKKPFRRSSRRTLWKPLEDGWEMRTPPPDRPSEKSCDPRKTIRTSAL